MFKALTNLFRPKLSREAFEAYYYRLPERIHVEWQRDGRMIVGKVSDGNREFVTQGRTPDEFIEMVNDAVYTVHDIPVDYVRALRSVRSFVPSQQERQKLDDVSVKSAAFRFVRNERVLRPA